MATIDVALALTFAACGILVTLIVLRVLVEALIGDPRSLPDRWRLRRKERLLVRADEAAVGHDQELSYQLLRSAFFLDHTGLGDNFIDKIYSHHLTILGRLVSMAEQHSRHLPNLPIVEDLLQSRSALMKSYREKLLSKRQLWRKRQDKGRATPAWAIEEYKRALSDLHDQITTNRRSLESQLDELFESLRKIADRDEVTYH